MKKIFNRLMATALASSCMLSGVAMNSNAILTGNRLSEEYLLENGYTKFDDHRMLYSKRPDGAEVVGTYTDGESYYTLVRQVGHAVISVPPEVDGYEIADLIYQNYAGEEKAFSDVVFERENANYVVIFDLFGEIDIPGNARNMLKDVSEQTEVYDFTYSNSLECLDEIQGLCEDITDYIYIEESDIQRLQNFVAENDFDFTVEVSDIESFKRCHLIPNENMTIDEQFYAAALIRQELDLDSTTWMLLNNGEYFGNDRSINLEEKDVDVLNSVDGDANEDGNMNIADAATVVQVIGNPDEYTVTSQGEFNADLDENGLTATDVFVIQKKVAEQGLPE